MSSLEKLGQSGQAVLMLRENTPWYSKATLKEKMDSIVNKAIDVAPDTEMAVPETKSSIVSRASSPVVSRASSPVEELEAQIDAYFAEVANVEDFPQEPTFTIDNSWVTDYRTKQDELGQRLNAIEKELETSPSKSRRKKLNRQQTKLEKDFIQRQLLLDMYGMVSLKKDFWATPEQFEEGLLPQILGKESQFSEKRQIIIANLCVAYLAYNVQKPEKAYKILLGLPLSQNPRQPEEMGRCLREGAYRLICNNNFDFDTRYNMAGQLFVKTAENGLSDTSSLEGMMSMAFIRYGKILDCTDKQEALAAIDKICHLLGDLKTYRKAFGKAIELSVSWLQDELASSEAKEARDLVCVEGGELD